MLKKMGFSNNDDDFKIQDIEFEDLFNIDDIQKLQDEFSELTGVGSLITKPDGTPITRPSNFCRLCNNIIRNTEKGAANCRKSDINIGKLCVDGPTVKQCQSGGLWDAGAGITAGGKHIASWFVGQIRDNTQDVDNIYKYALEIGADADAAVAAFEEVTYMPLEHFKSIAAVLFTFANLMSQLAYQNLQKSFFIHEHKKAENALRESEELFRNMFNVTNDAIFLHEADGSIVDVNDSALKLFQLTKEEFFNCSILDDLSAPSVTSEDLERVLTAANNGENNEFEWVSKRPKDGSLFPTLVNLKKFKHRNGYLLLAIVRDMTESKRSEETRAKLEEQLRQSQKMDAIGQLAGGVAHDFNNMLGGIIGAAEVLKEFLPADEAAHKLHHVILEAADNAAALTNKLLVFARHQASISTSVNLHTIIHETIDILKRTLDKKIKITDNLLAECDVIIGDASQLQSSLINLAINSSHAMPDGGELLISTSTIELDDLYCQSSQFDLTPGEYVEIDIRDTGSGIPAEIVPRIFEPFFTTKEVGKGTGLGLAAVYGTVRQHSGSISVYSEVGEGTCFHVLLPVDRTHLETKTTAQEIISGEGNILVVDDESVMRITAEAILDYLGYTVTTVASAREAIDIFRESPDKFDLVILDMIMPEMNGKECYYALRQLKPDVKVLISSGFTREEDIGKLKEEGLAGFIRKPFRTVMLSKLVDNLISK